MSELPFELPLMPLWARDRADERASKSRPKAANSPALADAGPVRAEAGAASTQGDADEDPHHTC
jgi:hypothetical protein